MRVNRQIHPLILCLLLYSTLVCADQVEYEVSGVDEPMLSNVINHVSAFRIGTGATLNSRLRRKMVEDSMKASVKALRPYGYFHPEIAIDVKPRESGNWLFSINVKAGPPVLVQEIQIELKGPGSGIQSLMEWQKKFPITKGDRLNQPAWDNAKQEAMNILEEVGFLQAKFERHVMRVDDIANTARLELLLDTGPQAVVGKVTFNQEILNNEVLASLQRFDYGAPYNTWLLEKFRLDLWRSGYFEDIEVIERRELTSTPPRVDLEVNLVPRKKNTYQSTLGYGTDTKARFQFRWSRHLLSTRGDNFDVGLGWQQKDNEFTFQANYRLPRKTETQQFWIASLGLKTEKQSLLGSTNDQLEDRFTIARGTVDDNSLRLGRTRVRNMRDGYAQLFETIFVQYLNENRNFEPTANLPEGPGTENGPQYLQKQLENTSNSMAVGVEWDWPEIRGNGFATTGHHERAWIMTSNDAWGSDADFSQVYLSSRWNLKASKRWKFLFRAEAGYSDATTTQVNVPTTEGEVGINLTELPFLYRFKAGGSRSVRGYAFEQLDDNGLGSSNIFTASAEVEFQFHEHWSAAAFFDIGNAFDDWSHTDLKRGSGLGLRWYSIIGALRLDVAKGLDLEGQPWRIHLTFGTPLL